MKKNILVCLLALSSVVLTGCSNTPTTGNTPTIVEESALAKHLKELRKGVSFEGTYNQSRVIYTDGSFTKPEADQGTDTKAQANVKFGFTSDSFYRKISTMLEGEEVPYSEDTYVKDEDGYAYREYLSYQNTIEKNYQMSYDNKCSFVNLGYGNPFNNITEEDLTLNEDNTYSLNLSKASDIFTTLLGFYASGIVNLPKSCIIETNANKEFTTIKYVLTPRKVADYNSMTDTTTYYITEQNVVLDIGTIEDGSLVKRLEPVKPDTSSQISKLGTALKNFNKENIEVQVLDAPKDGTESYKKMWYDGKSVYVKQYSSILGGSLGSLDAEFDYILSQNENAKTLYEARGYDAQSGKWIPSNSTKFGKTSQDKYRYEDLVFDISKVSTDLFKYDNKTNSFICDNIAAGDVALKGLQPKAKELANANLNYTDKISITLKNDKIDKIKAHYSYFNYYTNKQIEGEVTFSFRTPGSTKLPFDSKVENVGGTK